jgi:uncharacterized glyoxalase superfamily protein PhnB
MKNFFKSVIPVLQCKDVNETIEFYKTKLGFDNSWVHENMYGAAFNANAEFHFWKSDEKFTGTILYVGVESADDVYEFLKANGVEIIQTPVDRFYGMRECAIKDLNGHIISFANEIIGREPDVPKEV